MVKGGRLRVMGRTKGEGLRWGPVMGGGKGRG